MDPFRSNNQPTGAAAQAPPQQYNPFGEQQAAQQYNPYAQQQAAPQAQYAPVGQQQFVQPQFTNLQSVPQPGQQGFYNQNAQYQTTNVAYNPAQQQYLQQGQPQFQQPQLSNDAPRPGAPPTAAAQPNRPINQLGEPNHQPIAPTSKFWTVQFYQQFFDVDTRQVLLRMGNTLLPITCPDFLSDLGWHWTYGADGATTHGPQTSGQSGAANPAVQGASIGAAAQSASNMFETANGVLLNKSPDLYGPFWICTSLWMLTAIISNILSKVANLRQNSQAQSNAEANGLVYVEKEWSYDFTQALVAMCTVYLYVVCMSLLMWGMSRWKDLPIMMSHCLCTYGYSMFLFVLAAILCIIPVGFLQWLACLIACAWSALYIVLNFWFVWRNTLNRTWFFTVVLVVVLAHFALGMGFRFYFFNYEL